MTKPHKYNFTGEMDAAIRQAYVMRPTNGAIPGVKDLAAKWSIPTWAIKHRAAALGVAREKNPVWTAREIELLEKYASLTPAAIARKFAENWHFRTATAIKLKLTRFKIRRDHDANYYTASGLADCFGVDSHVVVRWIREGLLKAQIVQKRSDGQELRHIDTRDVKKFVVQNPMRFDIRKVDQLWFMDLITEGKVG